MKTQILPVRVSNGVSCGRLREKTRCLLDAFCSFVSFFLKDGGEGDKAEAVWTLRHGEEKEEGVFRQKNHNFFYC